MYVYAIDFHDCLMFRVTMSPNQIKKTYFACEARIHYNTFHIFIYSYYLGCRII